MESLISITVEKNYKNLKINFNVCFIPTAYIKNFAEEVKKFVILILKNSLKKDKLIFIKGKSDGPIWAFALLIQSINEEAVDTSMIAIYEKQMRGYVVIMTHTKEYALGQVIPDSEVK